MSEGCKSEGVRIRQTTALKVLLWKRECYSRTFSANIYDCKWWLKFSWSHHNNILQVFAIELVTFAVDFVPLAVDFGAFAVEFVGFAVKYCRITAAKATKCLNFLRHSLWGCSSAAKCIAYKGIIWPILEYAAQVRNPHTAKNINILESVNQRAACWAAGSRWDPVSQRWSLSSDECLYSLHWSTLKIRRQYLCVSFLYDILHNRYSYLCFNSIYNVNTTCTRQHPLCLCRLLSTLTNTHSS